MISHYKVPKILASIACILFFLGLLVSFFVYSQIESDAVKSFLVDTYNSDPSIQNDPIFQNATSAEGFAEEMVTYIKAFAIVPLISLVIITIINLVAIFMVNKLPRTSAIIFIILAVVSFMSVLSPILLIIAGIMILVKYKKTIDIDTTTNKAM